MKSYGLEMHGDLKITENSQVNYNDKHIQVWNTLELNRALSTIGSNSGTVVLMPNTYSISVDLTIDDNITVKFERGAILDVATGITVTINGDIDAGLCQIFDVSAGGSIAFGRNVNKGYFEWWGNVADDSTTNTKLNAALSACVGIPIYMASGKYKHDTTIEFNPKNIVIGTGIDQSTFEYYGTDIASEFSEPTGTANWKNLVLRDLTIQNRATGTVGLNIVRGSDINLNRVKVSGTATHPWTIGSVRVDGGDGTGGNGCYNNNYFDCYLEYAATGFVNRGNTATEQNIINSRVYMCGKGVEVKKGDAATAGTVKLSNVNFSLLSTTYDSGSLDGIGVRVIEGGIVISNGSRFEAMGRAYSHNGSANTSEIISNGDTISLSSVAERYYDESVAAEGYANVSGIGRGKPGSGNEGNKGISHFFTHPSINKAFKLGATGTSATALSLTNETDSETLLTFNAAGSIVGLYGTKIHLRGSIPTTGTHALGEYIFNTSAAPGKPMFYQCMVAGTPGTFSPGPCVSGELAKTADYTVLIENNGQRFSNTASTGAITFTLPAGAVGLSYEFRRIAGYALLIAPDGTQVIRGGAASKYLELQSNGGSVRLEWSAGSSRWEIDRSIGTLAYEA